MRIKFNAKKGLKPLKQLFKIWLFGFVGILCISPLFLSIYLFGFWWGSPIGIVYMLFIIFIMGSIEG